MENWREELYKQYTTNKGRGLKIQIPDCTFYKNKIKPLLPKDKSIRILDLAAGHGDLLYCLKKDGYKNIKGIDLSEEEIKRGKEIGVEELVKDDIFKFLAKTEETFDVIFLMDILEHLKRDAFFNLLKTVKKKLKNSGMLIIQVPNAEGIFGMRIRYGDLTHELAFTRNSLLQAITTTGFKKINFYEISPIKKGFKGHFRFILWQVFVFPFRMIFYMETGIKKVILSQNMIIKAET